MDVLLSVGGKIGLVLHTHSSGVCKQSLAREVVNYNAARCGQKMPIIPGKQSLNYNTPHCMRNVLSLKLKKKKY